MTIHSIRRRGIDRRDPVANHLKGELNHSSLLDILFGDGTSPALLHVTGDSTSNDPIDWQFKLADLIAARKPEYTTKYHLWNKASLRWGSWSQRTSGTSGNRYCALGTTPAARFNTSIDFSSITDLDVRIKLAASDWSKAGSTKTLCGADGSASTRIFWFYLNAAGTLSLYWFPDGTTGTQILATSTASVPFSNGSDGVVRVTLDVDNGAAGYDVKFWTSNTNGSWTQLGTTITGGATTNLFSATANFGIGARGPTNGTDADYHYCELRDSIDSVGVTAIWDASYYDGTNSFSGINGEVWTPTGSPVATGSLGFRVYNASQSGQTSLGWDTAPNFNDGHPVAPQVHMLNLGHNDGAATNINDYTSLLDDLETRWPNAKRVLVRQNDQPPTAANPTAHATRQELIRNLALTRKYELFDADASLKSYSGDYTVDLMQDWAGGNVHPNAAGGTQIANYFDIRFASPMEF